jgi:hypothetical protein
VRVRIPPFRTNRRCARAGAAGRLQALGRHAARSAFGHESPLPHQQLTAILAVSSWSSGQVFGQFRQGGKTNRPGILPGPQSPPRRSGLALQNKSLAATTAIVGSAVRLPTIAHPYQVAAPKDALPALDRGPPRRPAGFITGTNGSLSAHTSRRHRYHVDATSTFLSGAASSKS